MSGRDQQELRALRSRTGVRALVHHYVTTIDEPCSFDESRVRSTGIWELMAKHTKDYVAPDAQFPVPESPEPGYIVRYTIDRLGGVGPLGADPGTVT